MKKRLLLAPAMALIVLASGCASGPATSQQPPDTQDPHAAQAEDLAGFERAGLLVKQGKPGGGLEVLDRLIGRFEARYRDSQARIYSARTRAESVHYMAKAANDRQRAIDGGPTWSHAQYLKGYALV